MKKMLLPILVISFVFFHCAKPNPEKPKSSSKEITSFTFLKDKNSLLDADYAGSISGTSITIAIPYGIDVTHLVASFNSTSLAIKIGNTSQLSGVTINDFSKPITYMVIAEDNSSLNYTVTISRTGVAPNLDINSSTSFQLWSSNYFHTDLSRFVQSVHGGYWGDEFAAQAFYDFDKDGDKDLICGSFNFDKNLPIEIHFYKNNGGVFVRDQSVFNGSTPKLVHARQIILGDFDNNGWMDVVFAAHGWDQSPFPGEQQQILLNTNGIFAAQNIPLPTLSGEFTFNHSACSGDVDNDGDIDLFFTNNMRLASAGIFMMNNGKGTFTYDASVFTIKEVERKPCFSSNLYDIDADGYLDLVIAGHDRDQNHTADKGLKPTIFWGNYTGKYSSSRMTELPVIANYGVSVSISFLDFDRDGKTDILIGKTGDGTSLLFYQGYHLNLIKNNGGRQFAVSNAIQSNQITTGSWIVWCLPRDLDGDGDVDIASADKWYNQQWRNDNSIFVKY